MKTLLRRISLVFAAGALGGLFNSIAVWLSGAAGLAAALGVKLAPSISPQWLYPRIVWGGIWGFLFMLPVLENSFFLRGLLFSTGPTIVQLLVVFPLKTGKGVAGIELGLMTPALVVVFNVVWGLVASYWLKIINKNG